MSETPQLNALQQAMAAKSGKQVVVKAEDLTEDGRDWSETFFEPQIGESYTVKFLMNLSPLDNLVHRNLYNKLPDPKRKGKSFNYVSSNSASTCKALELFFELYELKKNGNVLAEQKIEKYLGRRQQGASLIQIISSPNKADIGKIRIYAFPNSGEKATIANLINEKQNPTKTQIENGYEVEDIFALTPTSVMVIECVEGTYDGIKGRDLTKSVWGKKEFGMRIYDGKEGDENRNIVYEFKDGDVDPETFAFKPEAEEHFMKAIKLLQDPAIDIVSQYAYKNAETEGLTEETLKYVIATQEKVDEVIPIIREATSIGQIEAKLSTVAKDSGDAGGVETIGDAKAEDILKESIPELDGSNTQPPAESKPAIQSVDDILAGKD